ncbi:hypothetical protein D9M71_528400 [compost metagenome]
MQLLAIGPGRGLAEHFVVQQAVHGMVHGFIQLVGEGFADQVVGDQIGHRGIQRDQRLAEVQDVAVIDLFHQAMRQVGLVEQALQAFVAGHQGRGLQEELFGDPEHRPDAGFDPGFTGDIGGGIQHVRDLFHIGSDETGEHALGILFRKTNGGVQAGDLGFQYPGQLGGGDFVLESALDEFAQCGGVHDCS